jgi:hypothetical protein
VGKIPHIDETRIDVKCKRHNSNAAVSHSGKGYHCLYREVTVQRNGTIKLRNGDLLDSYTSRYFASLELIGLAARKLDHDRQTLPSSFFLRVGKCRLFGWSHMMLNYFNTIGQLAPAGFSPLASVD